MLVQVQHFKWCIATTSVECSVNMFMWAAVAISPDCPWGPLLVLQSHASQADHSEGWLWHLQQHLALVEAGCPQGCVVPREVTVVCHHPITSWVRLQVAAMTDSKGPLVAGMLVHHSCGVHVPSYLTPSWLCWP